MNNWLRAIAFLPFLGLSACGGGGGSSTPANKAPTANFAFSCVDLLCSFTSTSSDQDGSDAVELYNWTFGDGTAAVANDKTPTHTFATGGTYDVTLKVGDRYGNSSTAVKSLTVTTTPNPAAPRANFTLGCVSVDCTFTDTSTYDPGSVPQSRLWDFGDGSPAATASTAKHTYSVTTLTSFTVKLTVTDAAGKTSTSVQNLPVSPPASTLNCVGGGVAGCVLTLTQASSVTATIVSHSCGASGNQVVITAPVRQTMFADGCYDPVGIAVPIDNGGNKFAANTNIEVAVLSGLNGTSGLVFPPSVRVTGDFAKGWKITFDDGAGGSGEPDFNDLVILIKATP